MIASDHKFTRDTTTLSMALMDKYFEKKGCVLKSELQSLGFTAVGIASKFEENKQMNSK